MSAKFKRSSTTIKTPSENILPKRVSTGSKEFRGVINEGGFSYNFRKFCIECNTTVIPNVKIISADDLNENTRVSHSNVSSEISSGKAPSEQKESTEGPLASIPEVLAVQNDVTAAIVEVIFRQFRVDNNMLIALTKTLKAGTFLRSIKLEFCNLSSKEILALSAILRKVETITEVSVNGNPNKYQNFHLLLKDTKLSFLSLRFCKIDADGMKKIADRINSYLPEAGLIHLNVSSNFLGDEGAEYIADALRANRTLLVLNLADNQITDKGCEKIITVLQRFPLNQSEIKLRRKRIFNSLQNKQETMVLISTSKSRTDAISASTVSEKSKESLKKSKDPTRSKKGRTTNGVGSIASSNTASTLKSKSQKSQSDSEKTSETIGVFAPDLHPFVKDTEEINREWCCIGNNVLMTLNLAYNKISQVGLRMIIDMMHYQKINFIDSGILRIILEGNLASDCCSEMNEIFDIIREKNEPTQISSLSSIKSTSNVSYQ